MILQTLKLKSSLPTPFQMYLLSDKKVKNIAKEFDFYKVMFYKEESKAQSIVHLQYPKGNIYWFMDFKKYITTNFLSEADNPYADDWANLLIQLQNVIKDEFKSLKYQITDPSIFNAKNFLKYKFKYHLRDYQTYDLLKFIQKYKYWDNKGLILSDPRTGKTRIALAACAEVSTVGSVGLIICPKSAQKGWLDELTKLNEIEELFVGQVVLKISDLKKLYIDDSKINIRIISYDLFKRLTIPQIRQLVSKNKNIIFIGDEIHRLRNFKTDQSKAIFLFKEFCIKDKINLGIIGLTGTPAVKESSDVFGTLCLINDSKIKFKPTYDGFDSFKEYFYYCEDTSYGKIAKALRRESELNFIIQNYSVQTKQKELELFKNYKKQYLKIELEMDKEQRKIYNSVYEDMEYDEDIDCQNKLVQLIRLQQICIDPFGLVASYDNVSPKLKWVVKFILKNNCKCIIASKKTAPLEHLMELLNTLGITYTSILGKNSYKERITAIDTFSTSDNCKCILLQLDTGREALTLPAASATIFLDRDFAQGFNEQAEARMTPIDGKPCTKYIIDLVMKNSKEEQIYQTLVVKKQSIDAINLVFKSKLESH